MIRHVRDLNDDRFPLEVEEGESINDIGVRAGDAMEAGCNRFAKHTQVIDGSDGDTAADTRSADKPHGIANIVEVNQRPTPDIGFFDGCEPAFVESQGVLIAGWNEIIRSWEFVGFCCVEWCFCRWCLDRRWIGDG